MIRALLEVEHIMSQWYWGAGALGRWALKQANRV